MPVIPLSPDDEAAIYAQLPDTERLFSLTVSIPPDLISMVLPLTGVHHKSRFPVAAVCLHDSAYTMQEALFAICEAMKHHLYYAERRDPPDAHAAVFYARFFADDAALRAYAAGEHLAAAILKIQDLDVSALSTTTQRGSSLQARVGLFMAKCLPDHPVTAAVVALASSANWQRTVRYRNLWVHEQPPRIAGLGDRFKRDVRWQESPDGQSVSMGLGGADAPELSAPELLGFVRGGLIAFVQALEAVVTWYVARVRPLGITVEPGHHEFHLSLGGTQRNPDDEPPSEPGV